MKCHCPYRPSTRRVAPRLTGRLSLGLALLFPLVVLPALRSSEGGRFRVASLKVMPVTGYDEAKAQNFAIFEKLARQAAAHGADLIVTPEGYLDGYLGAPKTSPGITYEKLRASADSLDSPYLKRTAALAKELRVHILFGFTERRGDKAFNSVAIFAPDGGRVGVYSKSHSIPKAELYDLDNVLPVFETALGRMGVLICFDRQPPENARTLALKGAQFIVVPAYGKRSTQNDEDILLRARAFENGVYVIYTSPRNAFVATPEGDIESQVRSDTDQIVYADVPLGENTGRHNAIRARRPEMYGELVAEPVGAR